MRKYLLIAILWSLSQQVFAQKIHITDSTNYWYTTGTDTNKNTFWTYYYYVGEQALNGYIYHEWASVTSAAPVYIDGVDYIREDTASGIVYINDESTGGDLILYKYHLHIGDTIHFSYRIFNTIPPSIDSSIIDSVIGVDSILINGYYYKVFSLLEIDTFNIHYSSWNPYLTYIEGIGSVFDPMNAQYRGMYYGDTALLQCFENNGVSPTISLPFTFPMAGHVDTFINHCAPVRVPQLPSAGRSRVQPNPIDENAKIVFSQSIVSGKLVVCNSIGQVVMDMPFENKVELIIGDKIRKPGMYFYEVMDEGNGAVYTGKFVKE